MDRRSFLKQLTLWSAGLLTVPPLFDITGNRAAAQLPDVSDIFALSNNGDLSGDEGR